MTRVLLAGVSTRAAAASAARAGFAVTAVDGYADLDRAANVTALSLPGDFGMPFTAAAAAVACRTIEAAAVAYLSNFDNEPDAVADLAAGRTLWGNPPGVLRRVRDPLLLSEVLRDHRLPAPIVANGANDPNVRNVPSDWLVKPLRSGGGHGIEAWNGGPVPHGSYLQERLDGIPASIVFVAAGARSVSLGVSRQLIGEAAFGASGYRYCGSIVSPLADAARDERLTAAAARLGEVLSVAFGLTGVNCVDVIIRDGTPLAIEVNPRWSASMELVERAYGLCVFAAHADACRDAALPDFDLAAVRRRQRGTAGSAVGKAIVFARRELIARGTKEWLMDPDIGDVPQPAARIPAGAPICTVFAAAADDAACEAALASRAQQIYDVVRGW